MAIGASTIWRVRPSGDNSNGGGYDPSISSPGTDYSQQNSPHVTFNGTTITATTSGTSATITISGYTVATTDVANVVHITGGTNFTTGWYSIQSVNTGAGTWTLDRNCSSGAGTAMTGKMGGGWADFWTNTTGAPIVEGNYIYILGSGIPNPSSYTYDYTVPTYYTPQGGTTTSKVWYAADPATPNYSTGGRPVINGNPSRALIFNSVFGIGLYRLYFVNRADAGDMGLFRAAGASGLGSVIKECILDQNGYDAGLVFDLSVGLSVISNEVWSSVAARGTKNSYAIVCGQHNFQVFGNNIHDTVGPGIFLYANTMCSIHDNIIANVGAGSAIFLSDTGTYYFNSIFRNCIYGAVTGIWIDTKATLGGLSIYNNIIVNCTGTGLKINTGTAADNTKLANLCDFNVYYNNTADLAAIDYGPNDTHGGSNPFVASGTENFAPSSAITYVNGFPGAPFLQSKSGQTLTKSYLFPGAVQPQAGAPSPTLILGI